METLYLAENLFTFSVIEPLYQKNYNFTYLGQRKFGIQTIDTLKSNIPFQTVVSPGGTVSHYQWYKDGSILEEQTDSILFISNPNFEHVGAYTCKVTNDIVSDLTLESMPKYLILPSVEFTIDKNDSANYNSISEAIEDLDNGTIVLSESQSIIFDIAPNSGPYNEQIIIPNIKGTNITKTININGNGNILTFDNTNCEKPSILQIDGTDYLTIANLNIEVNEDSEAGWAIHLKNEADNVQIVNCNINANSTATNPCFAGIVASNSDTTYLNNDFALGINANNTIVSNCDFIGGYAAIAMIGDEDTTMLGGIIIDNTIVDAYQFGILTTFSTGININNNQIDMTNFNANGDIVPANEAATCIAGISVIGLIQTSYKKTTHTSKSQQDHITAIQNNQLKGVQHRGISMMDCHSFIVLDTNQTQPPLILIANNRIEGSFNNSSLVGAGIYLEKDSIINCFHNSIQINGSNINGIRAPFYTRESYDLTIFNNSFAYTGDNGYSIYIEDGSGITWNYNNYYKGNSPTLAHYNGEDFFTLNEIPGNLNSISTEPKFIFTFNDDSELLDTASIGVASLVSFDFEGDVRPDPITLKPDIGANEFVIGVFDNTFNQAVDAPMIDYTTANQWQHVFKNDSIVVSINSNVNLGEITTNLYIDSVGVRKFYGKYCLDRNFRLEAGNNFSATEMVQIRLYITQRELDKLMEVDDKINSFKDLNLTYLNKGLGGDMSVFSVDGGETKFFAQENSQQISKDAYLLEYSLTGITQLGEFWLHGGEEALVVDIESVVPTFEGLSIYPNPFDEYFTLELDSPVSAQTDVVLMDIQGRVVYRYSFEVVLGEKRYELAFPSDLRSGVYLVEVRQGERKEVRKVLKR